MNVADEEQYFHRQWLSFKERTVDALALGADEGRNERRYASGSCK